MEADLVVRVVEGVGLESGGGLGGEGRGRDRRGGLLDLLEGGQLPLPGLRQDLVPPLLQRLSRRLLPLELPHLLSSSASLVTINERERRGKGERGEEREGEGEGQTLEGGRVLGATHWDRSISGGVEVDGLDVDDEEDDADVVEADGDGSLVALAFLDPEAFCCGMIR